MNHYEVLQVDPSAEPEIIEAAYKQLAAKYHPDRNPGESATARMKEINAAYAVLKHPGRRARYDRMQLLRIFRKPLGRRLKLIGGIVISVFAAVIWYAYPGWQRDEQRKQAAAALDLRAIFGEQLSRFTSQCTTTAKTVPPELASAYCSCLAAGIRARFDMSPIHVDSVDDYKRVFSTRFEAAGPGPDAEARCSDQLGPPAR